MAILKACAFLILSALLLIHLTDAAQVVQSPFMPCHLFFFFFFFFFFLNLWRPKKKNGARNQPFLAIWNNPFVWIILAGEQRDSKSKSEPSASPQADRYRELGWICMTLNLHPVNCRFPIWVQCGFSFDLILSCTNSDCGAACGYRCSKTKRPNLCKRACGSCCAKCSCVPPGTSGNYEACPCYYNLTTVIKSTGKVVRKCPWVLLRSGFALQNKCVCT